MRKIPPARWQTLTLCLVAVVLLQYPSCTRPADACNVEASVIGERRAVVHCFVQNTSTQEIAVGVEWVAWDPHVITDEARVFILAPQQGISVPSTNIHARTCRVWHDGPADAVPTPTIISTNR